MTSRKQNRPTVGVLVGWQVYEGVLNSFLEPVFSGIAAAAREHACNLLLACGHATGEVGVRAAWPAISPTCDFVPVGPWNTEGLLVITPLFPATVPPEARSILDTHHPIVFIGGGEPGHSVIPDNASGIRQALAHLVEHGHRRIAFITGHVNTPGDGQDRLDAYHSSLVEFGLEPDPALIAAGFHSLVNSRRAMQRILDSGVAFTAVVASNDESAFGAMQALREAGRRVPQDVAVIGFDDRLEAKSQAPPLSTVRYPGFEIGYRALTELLQRIADPNRSQEIVRVPTRLIVRQSCGCPAGPPNSQRRFTGTQVSPTEVMADAVLAEAQHMDPAEVNFLCQRLTEAFATSLEQESPTEFQTALEDILQRVEAVGDDSYSWQAAIWVLGNRQPLAGSESPFPPISPPEIRRVALAGELLHWARVAINRSTRRQFVEYAVQHAWAANLAGLLGVRLLNAVNEAEILKTLEVGLPEIGIRHARVIFFEPEGEDPAAWAILQTTPALSVSASLRRFPSRTFPPAGMYPVDEPVQLALLPLALPEDQRGMVAFDAGNLAVCATLVRLLAAGFKSTQLHRLKARLLSTVSHELRTPLNLIAGLSEMLLREQAENLSSVPDQYRADVERIHFSAQHLDGLIRDVLDLAQSEVGELKLTCEPLDLSETLQLAAAAGEQLARAKELAWQADLPSELTPVWGDRTRLRQVALNLVSNAVKFTARGKVGLQVEQQADRILVTVSDTGLGIPPPEQAAIFDEFRQSERTTARGYGGLGLGLAICKRLIELHGGEIGVRSSGEEGGGSTFYFYLPILKVPPAEPKAARPIRQTVWLMVEQAEAGERLRAYLEERGFAVEALLPAEPEAWLPRVSAAPPEAIVLDLPLASQRGWEILKYLKDHPTTQDVPVLVYNLGSPEAGGSLLELDYLMKPVGPAQLAQALTRQGATFTNTSKTILIVDDDPGVVEMNTRLVQMQSPTSRVIKAYDGRQALERLREERPDLVLLDLMMPRLDGFGVLEAMRRQESTRDIPVIVLTGQTLTEEDMARLNRGVASVLAKGMYTETETLAHVETALARHRKLGREVQRLVRRAMAYLHTHYQEAITREALARYVGVSDDHLTRCFRQETGVTPMVYLNRYRVIQAKALLDSGEKSVTEVAMAVGFSDRNYFRRVFQREVGVLPGDYRRGRSTPKK